MINEPNLSREEAPRPSREELDKIKTYSDENFNIIRSKVKSCGEIKRDIIVNIISALDYYIHDIIIWGVIEITENEFPRGKDYDKFKVSIKHVKAALSSSHTINKKELKQEIIKILSYETYQKWHSIKDGLKIILPEEINRKIGLLCMDSTNPEFKFETFLLEKLNKTRNSIVHTFDRDLYQEAQRIPVSIDINNAIDYIELIINSIHNILIDYDNTEPENYLT